MVYRIYILLIIISFHVAPVGAQAIPEIGFSIGTSQYMGDFNPSNLLYMPTVTGGINFIYNLNPRIGIKTQISYLTVKGEGVLDYLSQGNFTFSTNYIHYYLSCFVNFVDYNFKIKKDNMSPYFLVGMGYARPMNSTFPTSNHISIPFGPGIRFLIKNKISVGVEYIFNRSFNDNLEGEDFKNYGDYILNDPPDFTDDVKIQMQSRVNNVDWYSYLNLVITFKFINFADDCPAYESYK